MSATASQSTISEKEANRFTQSPTSSVVYFSCATFDLTYKWENEINAHDFTDDPRRPSRYFRMCYTVRHAVTFALR